MSERIIVAAPPGATRQRLERFLAAKGARVVSLARESAVAEQALVIEDARILWHGEDIVSGTRAAVVLDSGFMWPLPRLDPTPAEWDTHAGRFDDYLRSERETASLWYSLLEILADRLPRCVNPPGAFVHAALEPAALSALAEAGVLLPPQLWSNDPDAVADFAEAAGEVLGRPLTREAGVSARWLSAADLAALPLEQGAVALQRLVSRAVLSVTAVDGQGFASAVIPQDVAGRLATIQQTLEMPLAELTFRQAADGWALSDFSPSPPIGDLEDELSEQVLDALWSFLRSAP